MPAPSNIVLTPNSGLVGTEVTINADNMFNRPSYTARELFTQTGTDAPASDWYGGATPTDGLIGKAFENNGDISKYILKEDAVDQFSFSDPNGWSVSFYFNLTKTGLSQKLFSGTVNTDIYDTRPALTINTSLDQIIFYIKGITGNKNVKYSFDQYDVWNHIVCLWLGNNDYPKIYLNGELQTPISQTQVGSIFGGASTDQVRLGIGYTIDFGYYQPINGQICNYYKFNRVLTQSEIIQLANLPTITQDGTDITPDRYDSETSCKVVIV